MAPKAICCTYIVLTHLYIILHNLETNKCFLLIYIYICQFRTLLFIRFATILNRPANIYLPYKRQSFGTFFENRSAQSKLTRGHGTTTTTSTTIEKITTNDNNPISPRNRWCIFYAFFDAFQITNQYISNHTSKNKEYIVQKWC